MDSTIEKEPLIRTPGARTYIPAFVYSAASYVDTVMEFLAMTVL
jgi:hypothetical protein